MFTPSLAVYLNDHLAGSVVALETLDQLKQQYPANSDLVNQLESLRQEITIDRDELLALMRELHVEASDSKRGLAWVVQKMVESKLSWEDSADGQLHLFEALELISLGIEGKTALWAMFIDINQTAHLPDEQFVYLHKRARDQRAQIEQLRLSAGKRALLNNPSANQLHDQT